MSYVPSYTSRINWENEPSTASPINETNLNKMDYALYQHDQALQGQDSRISTLEGESKVTSFKGRTGAVTPANDDYTIAQIKATGTAGQVPTLNSQGKLEMADVPESGHEIVNPSGTSMTQRSKLKFMGSVSVSDDSTNDQTVINVTGGGGSGHTIQNPSGSSMTQRTNLQFTGTGVTVTDNGTDDKTVVNISSSGHTIKDGDGTAMPTQPNLQFADANVSNDGTGNATVVRNFVDIDWDDWQEVDDNDDTYYRVLNAPLADGTVEVDLIKKLWENQSPTSAFSAQNITLNSADYDFLMVITATTTGTGAGIQSDIAQKGAILYCNIAIGNGSQIRSRMITPVNDTTLSVDTGYSNGTANTGVVIPQAIYGIKQKATISIDAIAKNVRARVDYSTEEKVIGTWIDGSTLYEKTINYTTGLPSNTSVDIPLDITNLKEVVETSIMTSNGSTAFPIPYYDGTNRVNYLIRENTGKITLTTNSSSYTGFNKTKITLRYTKTT